MTKARHFSGAQWSLDDAVEQFGSASFEDGDIVSHDWLRMALDINDHAIKNNPFVLLERMESLKAVLLDGQQIALQSVRGKGYRVVPPHEQAYYAAQEAARYISKGLKKADGLLVNTRYEKLTTDENRRHTDTQVRIAALSGMVSKGKRDVFKLFEVKKAMPVD